MRAHRDVVGDGGLDRNLTMTAYALKGFLTLARVFLKREAGENGQLGNLFRSIRAAI